MPVPSYQTVPDAWKHPYGPYRQAPPEFGGAWWLVNPFTSSEPWIRYVENGPEVVPPAEFLSLFGERPKPEQFRALANPSSAYRAARVKWEQDLRYFGGVGTPPWADAEQMALSDAIFKRWGMGRPTFYEGRYGWLVRFPDSRLPRADFSAYNAIEFPHLCVAAYQIKLVDTSHAPEERHPFVPPEFWERQDETAA